MLREWELVDGAAIGIDSFKVSAQNSLKNNHNARKIKRHLDYIDGKINDYLEQLEKEDAEQEILRAKIRIQEERPKEYEDLKAKLKASGDGQFSTTDPDSSAVVFQRNSVKVGYNIQAVSDAKNQLLVAADTGEVNDTKALAKMVEIAQENLDAKGVEMAVIADKGYHSGRELKACEELEVTSYVSPKESSSSKRNSKFSMDKFEYEEDTDTYVCPADSTMKTNGNWYHKKLKDGKKSYDVKHYKPKSCQECKLRESCTSNKNGRVIERTEYQEYVNSNKDRVKNNPDYYSQRQQIIEHQFGTLKRHWGFEYVLSKGKENVLSEVYRLFTAYNLKRCMTILGFERLMAFIRCFFAFFVLKWPFIEAKRRADFTFC